MKKSILTAVMALFLLPAFAADETQNGPFNLSAQAGRSTPGHRWCECGSSVDCICDPGEEPCTSCPNQGMTVQQSSETPAPIDVDTGASFTILVASLLLVLRLRQL
jgi:hypothetical protein